MKDRETAAINEHHDEDGPDTEVTAAPKSSTDQSPAQGAADRTTRLLAEIFGTTIVKATWILDNVGGLEALAFASEPDLTCLGLPRGRARLLRIAFDLARQTIGARPQVGRRLSDSAGVYTHLRARLSGLPVEEFWAIALDVRHRVVLDSRLARGSLTGVEVHPRDIFRALIKAGAAAVIFCHNHPSGDPEPSRQDIELTERLREVGELCGIAVLDHVVVGATGYVSLAERGWR